MIIIYPVVKQAVTKFARFALPIIILEALASAAIILDIPFVRQILGFICFVPLLGMATLPLLKVKCRSNAELLVYSSGLGLVLLMVIGLIMNTLYPFIHEPLSVIPMLAALNIYMLVSLVSGLILGRDVPYEPSGERQHAPLKYLLAIAVLPALALLGTWAMNIYGVNLILIAMILAIVIVFLAVLMDRDVPEGVYPLLVLSASISLLFLYSLRSFHLMGFDVHGEFYTFSLTLANFHWSMADYLHIYNSCLSITILPTVLYSLLNVDPEYIFKLVMQVAFALMPLAVYLFFREKIDKKLALLAAFFMMSHYMFIYQMAGLVRQEIALLFFVLAVYVLFTDRIRQPGGIALFLLFSMGTVVSHYTTAFLYFFILVVTYLASKYMTAFKFEGERRVTAPLIIALLAMILFWHGLICRITLSAAIGYGINTLESVNSMLMGVDTQQAPIASMILGKGIQETLPSLLSWGIGSLSRAAVVLGVLYVAYITLYTKKSGNEPWMKFDMEYVIASLVLVTLVVISVLVPFMSVGYNLERLYMQALVFLAPMCVIGIFAVFRRFGTDMTVTGVGLMIAVFLLCQTGLMYQAFGLPSSISLNTADDSGYLIYPEEIAGAQWLSANETPAHVYADNYGTLRLWSYGDIPRGYGFDKGAYLLNSAGYGYRSMRYDLLNSYVYLDYYNLKDGTISDGWGIGQTPLSSFSYLDRLDEVYDNGGSAVLKRSGRSL
jgi:uncharacterized membrane protein